MNYDCYATVASWDEYIDGTCDDVKLRRERAETAKPLLQRDVVLHCQAQAEDSPAGNTLVYLLLLGLLGAITYGAGRT